MSSIATESKKEADKQDERGLVLAGLPFVVKAQYGSRWLEYDYDGRPLAIFNHLPYFEPIVRLMEMYRDLERQVAGLVHDREQANGRADKAEEDRRLGERKKKFKHDVSGEAE